MMELTPNITMMIAMDMTAVDRILRCLALFGWKILVSRPSMNEVPVSPSERASVRIDQVKRWFIRKTYSIPLNAGLSCFS